MKRTLLLLICFAMVLCSGCSVTLMGDKKNIPYETFGTKPEEADTLKMAQYKDALSDLANHRYEAAYAQFLELGNFRDAAEYAARFAYIEDTLLQTEEYTNGELTGLVLATYDQNGNLINGAEGAGELISRTIGENGELLEESWQYLDYILKNTYDAYRHVGTLSSQEKIPVFYYTQDHVYMGYSIRYTYDENGRLISDQGKETQYTQIKDTITNKSLPFSGTYTYDEAGNWIRYDREYTLGGQGSSWEIYTYDDRNRLIRQEHHKEGNVFFLDSVEVSDPYREETAIREYQYDDEGNLICMIQDDKTRSLSGEELERTYVQTEYTYENGRLTGETMTFGGTSDTVIQICYVYGDYLGYISKEDPNGN